MLTELVNSQRVNPRSCSCDDSLTAVASWNITHHLVKQQQWPVEAESNLKLCGARLDIGRGQASRPLTDRLALLPCPAASSAFIAAGVCAAHSLHKLLSNVASRMQGPSDSQLHNNGSQTMAAGVKATVPGRSEAKQTDRANGVYKKWFRDVKVTGHCDLMSPDHREATRYKHTLLYSC